MILIATIEHSGTHSLGSLFKDMNVLWQHCDRNIDTSKFTATFTTYRDPYRVAASWANRINIPFKESTILKWNKQWSIWRDLEAEEIALSTLPILNKYPDKLGLHDALDKGDLTYFFQYVSQEHIDFALECARIKHG